MCCQKGAYLRTEPRMRGPALVSFALGRRRQAGQAAQMCFGAAVQGIERDLAAQVTAESVLGSGRY